MKADQVQVFDDAQRAKTGFQLWKRTYGYQEVAFYR